MQLSTRLGRRIAVGLGLAGTAILLPTAALASSGHAGAAAHAAAAPACTSNHTRVWWGEPGDAATGHIHYPLQFSNIGTTTCTLFGYPGVSALDTNGNQVGLPATHSGAKQLVTLAPGATAHVILDVTQGAFVCSNPIDAPVLRVFAPGQVNAQLVPLATTGCPGQSVLHVDAMHPRAGIPGVTNS